jgi:hypothetical protein
MITQGVMNGERYVHDLLTASELGFVSVPAVAIRSLLRTRGLICLTELSK